MIKTFFKALSYGFIKEIRTFGMIFGIQIQPYKNLSSREILLKLKDTLLKENILLGISVRSDLLRLLPPLNITDNENDFLKHKILRVFDSI